LALGFYDILAFHGDGLTASSVRLIESSGRMLQVFGTECLGPQRPSPTGCFVPGGELGTLRNGDNFLALADDGQGRLFGLVAPVTADVPSFCADGCRLQELSVPERRVISSRTVTPPMWGMVNAAVDSECGMFLLAYTVGGDGLNNPTETQYRVDLLDYGSP
jgi:hypothetical protein